MRRKRKSKIISFSLQYLISYKLLPHRNVSVPCNNLFDIVTVRCGHCTNLWSVNMAAAFQSLSSQDVQAQNNKYAAAQDNSSSSSKANNKIATRPPSTKFTEQRMVVNRPPEKRQRVPSAYNQFIKAEIQRIKTNNPDINHREAFSTAAKNWAHFPHIHFGLTLETNNQNRLNNGHDREASYAKGSIAK